MQTSKTRKTSAKEMRKMRAKRAAELDFDEEKHWLKERLQIQKLWKGKKEQKKRDEKRLWKEENTNR